MIRAAFPIALAILVVPAAAPAPSRAAGSTPRDPVQALAPGVDLVPGRFVAGHQPDGNSVIFHGPDGLVVVDTGRHPEHTQEIVDLARRSHAAVKVVVNSHWHLDHIGGNVMLRREFSGLRVYASDALADAQKGFLADYRAQLETLMARSHDPKEQQAWRAEAALIDSGPALAPDVVVESSGKRELAGRSLDLELERYAATAGDVWVLDPATGVLAAGDLVTLPVPFLDTACPAGWKTALDHLAKADFRWLVPGHGPPLGRTQFETYRAAFGALVACAATARPKHECVDGWLRDAAELIPAGDRELARSTLDYYMENSLRVDRARSAKLCGAGAAGAAEAQDGAGAAALAKFRALAGDWAGSFEWTGGRSDAGKMYASYYLTGNGSAVVENLGSGGAPAMTTVYHMDGADLRMTHYCGAQNQPRLKADQIDLAKGIVGFAFVDATNLASPDAPHVNGLEVRFLDADHITLEFRFVSGTKHSLERIQLERAPKQPS